MDLSVATGINQDLELPEEDFNQDLKLPEEDLVNQGLQYPEEDWAVLQDLG